MFRNHVALTALRVTHIVNTLGVSTGVAGHYSRRVHYAAVVFTFERPVASVSILEPGAVIIGLTLTVVGTSSAYPTGADIVVGTGVTVIATFRVVFICAFTILATAVVRARVVIIALFRSS